MTLMQGTGDVRARLAAKPMATTKAKITVAYTPDSDDAFNYYAWEHGRVDLQGVAATFEREHIIALNRAAQREAYDVVGIS